MISVYLRKIKENKSKEIKSKINERGVNTKWQDIQTNNVVFAVETEKNCS